ncbi:MAG: DnaA ATPase domain-containing protein [Elusimicrobiota bacterium]
MEKWDIRPTPSADDPDRHVLLLKGGPTDVAALLKKFGALLGRPSPAKVKGFNLSLVLHRLKPAKRAKLEAWLEDASPRPAPARTPAAPAANEPAAAPASPPPSLPALAALPAAEPPPAAAPSEPERPALISLALEPPPAVPVPTMPLAPPPEPTAPAAFAAPAPEPLAAPSPDAVSVDLRADWTMDSLLVGAYNRFAHAAAMSVVTSPGTMYNPLFLYGAPGTGKSHMLHAIGEALSKGLGSSVLLTTSGSRLSRAVNAALAGKGTAEIEARAGKSKALLVDDLHLLAVSDQNKDSLAQLFKSFFDRKLQVVITSLYPPRSLGALEEALKFSFSKGWSVDVKIPNPTIQKDLISAAAERARVGLNADELNLLHEKLSAWGYSDLMVWLKRVAVLRKTREAAGQPAALQDILRLIYEPVLAGGTEAPATAASNYAPPSAPADAEPIAVITPKGPEGLGAFAARQFYEAGAKNGFARIYRHALWETYDPAVPFGVPFLIGEMCRRAAVTSALIVGPTPDSPLGPRSAEFAHAARRILESSGVELAFIPYSGLQLEAHYINAHLDLASARFP